jgi:hypothetical protein
MRAWWWLVLAPGCAWLTDDELDALRDADGDGFVAAALGGPDCDDGDPDVRPGAQLGEAPQTVYLDADGDGAGDPERTIEACAVPDGYVAVPGDCDDGDPELVTGLPQHRDADGDGEGRAEVEVSSSCDGLDAGYVATGFDCDDGRAAVGAVVPAEQYRDEDGDGLGDPAAPRTEPTCELAEGYVEDASDCDDRDAAEGAGSDWYVDADGDFLGDPGSAPVVSCTPPEGSVANAEDCDDTSELVGGDALQYPDVDRDGFGDPGRQSVATGCTPDQDHVTNGLDCDDTSAAVTPDTVWFLDADRDGVGDPRQSFVQCQPFLEDGRLLALVPGDCDDGDPDVGDVVWADVDGDGWGDSAAATDDCAAPATARRAGDCDDLDPVRHPATTWYADVDHDGFGDPASSPVVSCEAVPDAVAVDASTVGVEWDCDDDDPAIHPDTVWFTDADGDGAGVEPPFTQCDSTSATGDVLARVDGDCDDADPIVGRDVWPDADLDGWGDDGAAPTNACGTGVPRAGDCDDGDPALTPDTIWAVDLDGDGWGSPFTAGTEVQCASPGPTHVVVEPDPTRFDCDEGDATRNPETAWYVDGDDDGVGGGAPTISCQVPDAVARWVPVGGDCDDDDPDATDVAYVDVDGDGFGLLPGSTGHCLGGGLVDPGYALFPGDCDDTDPTEFPGVRWYRDDDGDGHGTGAATLCARPPALVSVPSDGDCDDLDASVHPGAVDPREDGRDQDCDGTDLDGSDADELPDLPGCGAPTQVEVNGPGELATALQDLSYCTILSLAPGDYPGITLPVPAGLIPGPVMVWGRQPGVRFVGSSSGIEIPGIGVPVVLEGLELVDFEDGAVVLDGDDDLVASDLLVVGGSGIVDPTDVLTHTRSVTVLGTVFQGTGVTLGRLSRQRKLGVGLDGTDFVLRRVSTLGALTPTTGLELNALGDVELTALDISFSAALGSVVRVHADGDLTVSGVSLTESLAGRALQLSAKGALDVDAVLIQDNGFVGDQDRAIVELQGSPASIGQLFVLANVTDGATVTWLASCADGDPCAAPAAAPTTLTVRDVVLARNDSMDGTTAMRLRGTGSLAQVVVHQQNGRWLDATAGLSFDHATFAGRPSPGPTPRARFALQGPVSLSGSVLDYLPDEVPLVQRSGLGALTIDDTLVDPGLDAWCGPLQGCVVNTPVDGRPYLMRSWVGMDDGDADFRFATSCDRLPPPPPLAPIPAVPCVDSPAVRAPGADLGAFAPDVAGSLYADLDDDGLLDDWEATWFLFDPDLDADGDGLSNLYEHNVGTFPDDADSDDDGIDDFNDAAPFEP